MADRVTSRDGTARWALRERRAAIITAVAAAWLLQAGASHEEIVDAIGVAILMGGGPSDVYGSQALEALKQFEAEVGVS